MRRNERIFITASMSTIAISLIALLINIILVAPAKISAAPGGFGDSIPEINCANGMEATIFADGLHSPDGLAFGPNGLLHFAEETAGGDSDGKISQISSSGVITTVLSGLVQPEGIAFDNNGNLYYVDDDIDNGGVTKRTPAGVLVPIAGSDVITSPEGIVIGTDGTIYVSASDAEKAVRDNPGPSDVNNYKTYLYAFASSAPYTPTVLLEITPDLTFNDFNVTNVTVEQPSFSGITIRADGKIYLASESSGVEETQQIELLTVNVTSTRSVFIVDPLSPPNPNITAPPPFIEHLTAPEGIRFQGAGATFPLLIVEEGAVGSNSGRLLAADSAGNTTELCIGFGALEDVIVDSAGNIYVTDDTNGRIVKLTQPLETPTSTVTPATPISTVTPETPTSTPTTEAIINKLIYLPLVVR